jgi:hypothetical protein
VKKFNLNAFKLNVIEYYTFKLNVSQLTTNFRKFSDIRKDAHPESDHDESSEDGMLVLGNRDSSEDEDVDIVNVTKSRDSIICPRYDPCVLRYGKLPRLLSSLTTLVLYLTFNLLTFNLN